MPARRKATPSYLPHSQSGKARAVWTDSAGTRHYRMLPGAYDSKESREAFARLLLELEAAPHQPAAANPAEMTMAELLLAFLDHAERHYRGPDGKPTSEIYEVKVVVRANLAVGDQPAAAEPRRADLVRVDQSVQVALGDGEEGRGVRNRPGRTRRAG